MMAQNILRSLDQSDQGICILNRRFEKMYENEKARLIFTKQCPGLFQQLAEVCQNIAGTDSDSEAPFASQSSVFRYPAGTVVFGCVRFGKGTHSCFHIVFEYVSLLADKVDSDIALTPREKEIVQIMATGKTNKEISRMLCIRLETVKSHIRNLFAKTGTSSRVELVGKVLHGSR
jgi:DNA-binding CsgD family transcriptional regulator